MWRPEDPQGNEAQKIKYEIVPYTRGQGLDIGCGPFKAFDHFIGVDNGHHAKEFGWEIHPDVSVTDATDLRVFASQSMDFVFSSHLLEHIEDTDAALKEWWRVIKPGGYLVLYLPDKSQYPNMGEPGANPDHKHDFHHDDIILAMEKMKLGWDLLRNETRDADYGPGQHGNEYSFFQVYKKRSDDLNRVLCAETPKKSVCVVRYGGFGDMIQAASIMPWLKEQGYHITVMTTPNGQNMLKHDPHVDNFLVQDTDQVPNEELPYFWSAQAKNFDKFINLSESVEGTLLAIPGRTAYRLSKQARHFLMDRNYLEMVHAIAEVPEPYHAYFYPSQDEIAWAAQTDKEINPQNKPVIVWSLAGSSVNKAWPHLDAVIARIMLETDAIVVMVGDILCQLLECGWENEPRAIRKSGIWEIRQSLTYTIEHADLVIGTETGLLNAVGMVETIPKIVTLSHSSQENLTKHWANTLALTPENVACYPCHMLHYGFDNCDIEDETHTAQCQFQITADMMWEAVGRFILTFKGVVSGH
ncbi:MAG: methyltransferase domain-containing protein [Kiritimatiellaceae bacterium]|nr:methyltransferase domain-containing protein [Kiritimatiellaceae bacterium]